jgi:signal transduction histidine kinase
MANAILADRFFYFSALRDEGIFPVGIIIRPTELYFAFTKNHDPDLTERFDKHISVLRNDPGSVYYQSLQKWFDKDVVMFTPRYILWSFVLLAAVLVFVVLFNLLLQTQVKAKTKMLRQLNHDLMLEKEKAEESDRLKTAFLTNMNHEIRTPMNSIMGFAAMLKNHHLSKETRLKYAEIIEKSGDRLLGIINNIVEISRIESDTAHVNLAESNINEQMEHVFDLFRPQAEAKNLRFDLSVRLPDQWARIVTDRQKLFTILFHLVLNAIKYTKQGSIEFGCVKKDSWLEFFVKDTGIGIPKNRQQAIFDRFVQADIEDKEALQGAGLGLSISKAYVEMLGGTIWVESKVGEGSILYFIIPDQPAE